MHNDLIITLDSVFGVNVKLQRSIVDKADLPQVFWEFLSACRGTLKNFLIFHALGP